MRRRTLVAGLGLTGLAAVGLAVSQSAQLTPFLSALRRRLQGKRTPAEVTARYGAAARARLAPGFAAAGVAYPPPRATFIGLKAEKRLEIWVPGPAGRPVRVADMPVLAASGGPGPKLREGDRQVPEGLYRLTFLNANSLYHLSLRIGYPSAEDRRIAAAEGRSDLGGDIMIHGPGGSVGCLSIGTEDVESVFVLVADIGLAAADVILTPFDMRGGPVPPAPPGAPSWTAARYAAIHAALRPFAGGGPTS